MRAFTRLILASLFFLSPLIGVAAAENITGKWRFDYGYYMEFVQSGGTFSGFGGEGSSYTWPITNGVINGNQVSWHEQYNELPSYQVDRTATIFGDTITGTWKNTGSSSTTAFTATRVSGGTTTPTPTATPDPSKRNAACTLFCNRTGTGGFTADGLNTADCFVTVGDGKSKQSGLIPTGPVTFAATDGFLPASGQCQLTQSTQVASCNFKLSIPSVPPFPIGVRFPISVEFPGDTIFNSCTAGHHLLVASCPGSTLPGGDPACTESVGLNTKDKPKISASGVLKALVECGGNLTKPTPAEKQELCIVDGKYSTTLALTLVGITGDQFLKIAAAITAKDIAKFPALKFIKDANKKYNAGELTLILSSLSDINKLLKGKRTSIEVGAKSIQIGRASASKNKAPIVTTFSVGTLSASVKANSISQKSVKVPQETRQLFAIFRRIGITSVPVTVSFTASRSNAPKKKKKGSATFTAALK